MNKEVVMKRQGLTANERETVIRLKNSGISWLKIQHETGINRRTAKRAYEKWQHSKSTDELKRARQDVAARAFSEHIDILIRLAESLVGALRLPERLSGLVNADEALDRFWISNILDLKRPPGSEHASHETEHIVWKNKMLFKSLQEHTKDKVRWQTLEEWKEARNSAVRRSRELRLEAAKIITDLLNKHPDLKDKVITAVAGSNVTEKLSNGVMETVWRGILTENQEQVHAIKGASTFTEGQVWLEFYKGDTERRLLLNDEELAKEVCTICRRANDNLRKGRKSDLVQALTDEVSQMRTKTRELEESLDELLLRPMILLTRCDLCPA